MSGPSGAMEVPAGDAAFVGEVDAESGARLFYDDGTGVRQPVPHVVRHSRQGLSWGYDGNGPGDTALSILSAATGDADAAEQLHEGFMHDVVATLSLNERFLLPRREVDAWLTARGVERRRSETPQRTRAQPPLSPSSAAARAENDNGRMAPLAARARQLAERERRLVEREARVDAMAVTLGLVPEVDPVAWLPAEPLRRHLEALVVDSGDDVAEVARANRLDPQWTAAVAAGTIARVDLAHVRQVCEGMRCTPYDLWGPTAARSVSHAYGPDEWPAVTEPLMAVDGSDAIVPAVSMQWPAPAERDGLDEALDGPELARDLGPGLAS